MSAATFDTLEFDKQLQKGGFTDAQAETLTKAIAQVVSSNELATKKDLKETELVLRNEFDLKIAELKTEIIKWMLGVSFAQAAIIISCIKFIH